jgi:hypothetical protein
MPASERFPGQHKGGAVCEFVSSQRARFAFGEGCDHSSYVKQRLRKCPNFFKMNLQANQYKKHANKK